MIADTRGSKHIVENNIYIKEETKCLFISSFAFIYEYIYDGVMRTI